MNLDIAELVAAMIIEAGGTIAINAETLARGFEGKAIAIDQDPEKMRLLLSLVETDDIDYEDENEF